MVNKINYKLLGYNNESEPIQCLYLVEIQSYGKYGKSYVRASNPHEAYVKYRKFLDENDICYESERELKSVILIAKSQETPHDKIPLFIQ